MRNNSWIVVAALVSCSPPALPLSTLTISAFTATSNTAGDQVEFDATFTGDGVLDTPVVEVRRGDRVIKTLTFRMQTGYTATFDGSSPTSALFDPTENAATGATLDVPLVLRVVSGTVSATQPLSARIGCGASGAICAGKCATLTDDANNCGQCGKVCTVQLSTDPYKGRCINSVCNWPGVTISAPSSCDGVCDNISFGGSALRCVHRCGYLSDGSIKPGLDAFPGAVTRSKVTGNTTYVLSSCTSVPSSSTTDGNLLRQLCCCGP